MYRILNRPSIIILLLVSLIYAVGIEDDLYKLLGVKRSASTAEIKTAYRKKAKETHPDKNLENQEAASEEFRKIANAFEILSDKESRKYYDATGSGDYRNRMNNNNNNQQPQQNGNFYNFFHFNFGGGFGGSNNQRRFHRYLYDPYHRSTILSSQSRIIRLRSLDHLMSIAGTEEGLLDRYTLIAFASINNANCKHELYNLLLYPWPFAGYSSWESSDSIYWDEIMLVGLVVIDPKDQDSIDFANYFSVDVDLKTCPQILLLNRGDSLEQSKSKRANYFQSNEHFSSFVWPALKVQVRFTNKSLWPVDLWWLHGTAGKKMAVIPIGDSYHTFTYLSHTFIARATKVESHALTNESSLMWFTAKINDDNTVVEIIPRCFDLSGDCKRWAAEGFCETNSKSVYVLRNPTFTTYVQKNCLVSCKKKCSAEFAPLELSPISEQQEGEKTSTSSSNGSSGALPSVGLHPAHRYHSDEL